MVFWLDYRLFNPELNAQSLVLAHSQETMLFGKKHPLEGALSRIVDLQLAPCHNRSLGYKQL